MNKIIDYMACHGDDVSTLVDKVRFLIGEGWQPLGNPIKDVWCADHHSNHPLVQMVVKFESETKNALEEVKEILEIVNK
jgi:hypothetical protein